MSTTVPYKNARIIILNLTAVFATVAACIGLHALVRANRQKSHLKTLSPLPSITVKIDTSWIQNPGICATAGNILMAATAFLGGSMTLLPITQKWANKTLRLQAGIIGFCTVWVFACMIPFMVAFCNDSARVTAVMSNGMALPESTVASFVAKSGTDPRFKTLWFLRLLAILPWFAIASGMVATFVLVKAIKALRESEVPAAAGASASSSTSDEKKETSSVEHNEKAQV